MLKTNHMKKVHESNFAASNQKCIAIICALHTNMLCNLWGENLQNWFFERLKTFLTQSDQHVHFKTSEESHRCETTSGIYMSADDLLCRMVDWRNLCQSHLQMFLWQFWVVKHILIVMNSN